MTSVHNACSSGHVDSEALLHRELWRFLKLAEYIVLTQCALYTIQRGSPLPRSGAKSYLEQIRYLVNPWIECKLLPEVMHKAFYNGS